MTQKSSPAFRRWLWNLFDLLDERGGFAFLAAIFCAGATLYTVLPQYTPRVQNGVLLVEWWQRLPFALMCGFAAGWTFRAGLRQRRESKATEQNQSEAKPAS